MFGAFRRASRLARFLIIAGGVAIFVALMISICFYIYSYSYMKLGRHELSSRLAAGARRAESRSQPPAGQGSEPRSADSRAGAASMTSPKTGSQPGQAPFKDDELEAWLNADARGQSLFDAGDLGGAERSFEQALALARQRQADFYVKESLAELTDLYAVEKSRKWDALQEQVQQAALQWRAVRGEQALALRREIKALGPLDPSNREQLGKRVHLTAMMVSALSDTAPENDVNSALSSLALDLKRAGAGDSFAYALCLHEIGSVEAKSLPSGSPVAIASLNASSTALSRFLKERPLDAAQLLVAEVRLYIDAGKPDRLARAAQILDRSSAALNHGKLASSLPMADVTLERGVVSLMQRKYDRALAGCDAALSAYKRLSTAGVNNDTDLKLRVSIARAYRCKSMALSESGRGQEAIACWQSALPAAESLDPKRWGEIVDVLGDYASDLEISGAAGAGIAQAENLMRRAVAIRVRILPFDVHLLKLAQQHLAIILRSEGKYAQSLAVLGEYLKLSNAPPYPFLDRADMFFLQGQVLGQAGDRRGALQSMQTGLRLALKNGAKPGEIKQIEKAIALLERQLKSGSGNGNG